MPDLKRVGIKKKASLAERTKVKAAIGIDGTSGNGKTSLALMFAKALAGEWDKIYVTDAENDSAKLTINTKLSTGDVVGNFYHNTLDKDTGYSPFNYEYCQNEALELGCNTIIQDTFSNSWNREYGVLDMKTIVETSNDRRYNDNYRAWGHPDVSKGKNLIFDLIRSNKMHVISTLRIKSDFQMSEDPNSSKTTIKEVGLKQIQTEGLTYEFDLLLRMVEPGNKQGKPPRVEVLKSRYDLFEKGHEYLIDKELLAQLKEYLEEGISIEELAEKSKVELVESLKNRALNNQNLKALVHHKHPESKLRDLTLEQLRELNSDFIELEYE